ncbi:MAG: hypothetical protein GX444_07170 [Myxococcales bacterium]|nr:hypothetical protein [Myxococcales bacterium]
MASNRVQIAGLTEPVTLRRLIFADDCLPEWLLPDNGFSFPSPAGKIEPAAGQRVLATWEDGTPAVAVGAGEIRYAFDPGQVRRSLLREKYFTWHRPLTSRLPFNYQLAPGRFRLMVHQQLVRRRLAEDRSIFPHWPIEPAADALQWLMVAAAQAARGEAICPARPQWPEGKRAAVLFTHDLDKPKAFRHVAEYAAAEENRGIRSCWFAVGRDLPRFTPQLEDLHRRGHEIGLHGDVHDNRLPFLALAEIERRLAPFAVPLRQLEIRGFRAPSLFTSPRLDKVLSGIFTWSSSTIDTDLGSMIATRRGATTVFPFEKDDLLEIPVTIPLDDRLLTLGYRKRTWPDLWRRKLDWLTRIGGIAVFVNHLENHLSGRAELLTLHERLLDLCRERGDLWITTPSELAAAWRKLTSADEKE